jgi:hypothetical protein
MHLKLERASSIILNLKKISSINIINRSTLKTEATKNKIDKNTKKVHLLDKSYDLDDTWTNLNQNILSKIGTNIYQQKYHPLNHIINQIKSFFYKKYINRSGNALFSIYDNLNPVVTVEQNFDRY